MTISETDCLTGYVLHTRKFQETSLLVEFFSRDEGRGSLLFKGIRRQQKNNYQAGQSCTCFVSYPSNA